MGVWIGPFSGIEFAEEDYFQLVDWSGRAMRDDKLGSIPDGLIPILERLQLDPDAWLNRSNPTTKIILQQ